MARNEDHVVRGISPLTGERTDFVYNGAQPGFMGLPPIPLWTEQDGDGSTYAVGTIVEAQFPDE